jgi:hypothetical protein
LVREAIDRGVPLNEVKPGNKITAQLKRFIIPQTGNAAAAGAAASKAPASAVRAAAQPAGQKARRASAL